jgi:hypothetical protein
LRSAHLIAHVVAAAEGAVPRRLIPFTVDGLILVASMLILNASRRNQPVPPRSASVPHCALIATLAA